ncbi:hypothetical protein ACVWZ4_005217 [Bradyrhizobium sp. USDA 4472]
METRPGSERIFVAPDTDPLDGHVQWAPEKSLWLAGGHDHGRHRACAGLLLLVGIYALPRGQRHHALRRHSVGMHRKLIHASFDCPLWLEHLFVYLGTLVGMAGPFGMIRLHDFRDWAQRQGACHDYSRHHAGFWRDAWWQLHCRLVLRHPPDFRLEPRLAGDRFYAFVERTWMLQQLPWALLFFAIGGMDWLVWGICVRVSVCVTGHWLVGHFSHTRGEQIWIIDGVAAQGATLSASPR